MELSLNVTKVQGVHKVSLQFRKFITKANEKTDDKMRSIYI